MIRTDATTRGPSRGPLESPGVVTSARIDPAGDAELTALATTDRFLAAGARAVDVDTEDGAFVAYGLFDPRVAPASSRPLPEAEHVALPDLTRRPVTLAGLRIVAGDAPNPADPAVLAIDAAGAFGVGLHPTTAMMLVLAQECPVPHRVLDVGTGTGILALAQLKRGAACAVGTDIADAAHHAAPRNAARAGLGARFTMARAILGARRRHEAFDLVLANIRARTLVALSADLARAVAPDKGRLLVSGVRFYEGDRVEAALGAHGLTVDRRLYFDGWWCLAAGPTRGTAR